MPVGEIRRVGGVLCGRARQQVHHGDLEDLVAVDVAACDVQAALRCLHRLRLPVQEGRDERASLLIPVHNLRDKRVGGLRAVEQHAGLLRAQKAAGGRREARDGAVDRTRAEQLDRPAAHAQQPGLRRLLAHGNGGGEDLVGAVPVKIHDKQSRIALLQLRLRHAGRAVLPLRERKDAHAAHAALAAAPAHNRLLQEIAVHVAEEDAVHLRGSRSKRAHARPHAVLLVDEHDVDARGGGFLLFIEGDGLLRAVAREILHDDGRAVVAAGRVFEGEIRAGRLLEQLVNARLVARGARRAHEGVRIAQNERIAAGAAHGDPRGAQQRRRTLSKAHRLSPFAASSAAGLAGVHVYHIIFCTP